MPGVMRDRRIGLGRSSGSSMHPDTRSYRDRIIANGGIISDSDLKQIDSIFVRPAYLNGWRSASGSNHLAIDCCLAAGENLAAAQVKLWYPSGVPDKVTLVNVVAGDYSRSTGFTFNGSTKYANTHLNPATAGLGNNSVHLGVYNRTATGLDAIDLGSQATGDGNGLRLHSRWSDGNCYWDAYNASAGRVARVNTNPLGLTLANRLSTTDSRVIQAGTQLGAIATGSGGTVSSLELFWGALNNGGTPSLYAARNYGGYSIGLGIPSILIPSFNSAWQTLMATLGRAV